MRKHFSKTVEDGRLREGPFATKGGLPHGAFFITCPRTLTELKIIVGDAVLSRKVNPRLEPWDHVSVSTRIRCPTWEEMCFVKDLFFEEDECVVQFHPPKKDYINEHPYVLHLWRPDGFEIKLPPGQCV